MKRIVLLQIGIGTVGGAVVEQVLANHDRWRSNLGIDVGVGAVVGTTGAVIADDGELLSAETLRQLVDARRAGGKPGEIALEGGSIVEAEAAVERLAKHGMLIAVDAAAGEASAAIDGRVLDRGGGVVLSNKAPMAMNAGSRAGDALWAAAGTGGRVRYEATCGAGLPVISTLRTLLDTGDVVTEITGALSGTLGAIFSDVATGRLFSAAVRSAKDRGYTEPDPRDDLSGLDVARKALILARTIGRAIDLDELAVESLVPTFLQKATVDEFLERVTALDAGLKARSDDAQAAGKVLKYVATVVPEGRLAVGVREIPTSTVLGALQGPENIISIRTERYDAYPLTVTGPGAGAAVTAAGMLADVLALATIL